MLRREAQRHLSDLIRRCGACVAALSLVCILSGDAWGCPTCKDGLADTPQMQNIASGFYYSILFMMSMPFLIVGVLGTAAYRSIKRAQAEVDKSDDSAAPPA